MMTRARYLILIGLVALIAFLVPTASSRAAGAGDAKADLVWGQPDLFQNDNQGGTSGTCLASPTASSLCSPKQTAVDSGGNLWVADTGNNRVLMFPAGNGRTARAGKVLGQSSFTTKAINSPGAGTLRQPGGIAIDVKGTLYVADTITNRVLVYFHTAGKANGAAADLVLGQPDFTHSGANDNSGAGCPTDPSGPATACSLNTPQSLSVDAAGDLLVADMYNNRVLLFPAADFNASQPGCAPSCHIAATQVWGQYGSFFTICPNQPGVTTCAASLPAPTADSLAYPYAAVADAAGNLYVADQGNNRVLEYDDAVSAGMGTYRQTATLVYGQGGDFTANVANNGGLSASSLSSPRALALDSAGDLWVADTSNNRVLEFPTASTGNRATTTTAVWVLGQRGLLTSGAGQATPDAGSFVFPLDVSFDRWGNAFVADYRSNRLVAFQQPYPISARIGLAPGWNLVSLPGSLSLPYSASFALGQIQAEGGNATLAATYQNGRYQLYVPGYAADFSLTPTQGFWVLATKASLWLIT